MDVLHQVLAELAQAGVERTPGGAGPLGRGDVVGQRHHLIEVLAMVVVLMAHHRDGALGLGTHAAAQHREEDLLLLLHVALHLLVDGGQEVGQAVGAGVALAVDLLDPARHADQLRELLAVHVVV